MDTGVRDMVQNIQLSLLQDYLEIMMVESHGKEWIKDVVTKCEENMDQFSYKNIVNIKKKKGIVMITKKSFDVTLLIRFLTIDFLNECRPIKSETDIYKNYLFNIRDNKNSLASHLSDLDNKVYIAKLVQDSIYNIQELLLYLDRSKWGEKNSDRQGFLSKYNEEIEHVDIRTPEMHLRKARISIFVQDSQGYNISGFGLLLALT